MSTFSGFVPEFPDIRIDYFRKIPDRRPPLACFLSHVHSDHLQGLEGYKSPFVYCSAATRELLLRLEKFPHRMNFAKGILETRKVHYRHLKSLLRAIPLNSPTEIELAPGQVIRVTLLDANHCAGAVMFLIDDTVNAILYTGDVRAEPWWVHALAREPTLIPFVMGQRRLRKIYLDTTFATNADPYRNFPTKAEGLQELLTKLEAYPQTTVFHLNAWTFGYEGVWSFLASALGSQIHVDRYKWELYSALASCSNAAVNPQEGPALCGFQFGNRYQPGCLTDNEAVRIHTCERGLECNTLKAADVVWITPIISRASDGADILELGAGGGGGDLEPSHQIDLNDPTSAMKLMKLCSETISDSEERARTLNLITKAMKSDRKAVSLEGHDALNELENMPLERVAALLQSIAAGRLSRYQQPVFNLELEEVEVLSASRNITFPYSRHSSYGELCELVAVFKPMDVYPCTVDHKNWENNLSMKKLFGHLCSAQIFAHDEKLVKTCQAKAARRDKKRNLNNSQDSESYNAKDDEIGFSPGLTGSSPKHLNRDGEEPAQEAGQKKARLNEPFEKLNGRRQSSQDVHTILTTSITTSDEKRLWAIKKSFEARLDEETGATPDKSRDALWEEHTKSQHYDGRAAMTKAGEDMSSQASMKDFSVKSIADQGSHPEQQQCQVPSQRGVSCSQLIELADGMDANHDSTTTSDIASTCDDDQLSLPDSAFTSQTPGEVTGQQAQSRIYNRKEAYKAASRRDGLDWVMFSPISSSNRDVLEDIELK